MWNSKGARCSLSLTNLEIWTMTCWEPWAAIKMRIWKHSRRSITIQIRRLKKEVASPSPSSPPLKSPIQRTTWQAWLAPNRNHHKSKGQVRLTAANRCPNNKNEANPCRSTPVFFHKTSITRSWDLKRNKITISLTLRPAPPHSSQ